METLPKIPRREFIRLTAVSVAALAVGCVPTDGKESKIVNLATTEGIGLNPYILIETTGKITVFNHRPEMGQGVYQAIPMILAEELEVDLESVAIKQSPANRGMYGDQMVVGSRSIRGNYELMRKMGASAKEMLIKAAAQRWNVNVSACHAENATVVHQVSGKKFTYGELVEEASRFEAPENPALKDPKDFKIIGKSLPRRDIPLKTNGRAQFGCDFSAAGMLYASVERSPVFLGKVVSVNDAKAKAIAGVKHVFKTQRNVWGYTREGVAVLADSYWAALLGRKALEITWDNGDLESWNSKKISDNYHEAASEEGVAFKNDGNTEKVLLSAGNVIEALYETPYQSHAPMEPMNATVSVGQDQCEFWGSTQNPNGIKSQLSRQTGLPEEKITVNYTFMGGGFGRRSMTDVVEEAADLSIKAGAPVKVMWSREDDITQGPFRACSLNICKGVVDQHGNLMALSHKVVCQDIRNQSGDDDQPSGAIVSGINTEYAIPNFHISGVLRKLYVPITYWRSVYHSTNCFAHESFMDELARAANKDPLDFRLALLKDHLRYTEVLQTVAKMSDWYKPQVKDRGKGIAIVERSGAFVAMVAEVARVDGKVRPVKITCAVDCGIAVNPDIVKAQTEGSIVMGLTAAYKSAITIEKGKVAEKNFDTYKMLELHECPEIEVAVMKSGAPPEGAGEAGLPTVAPALTNAIFNMTGKRIRKLPFALDTV
jgi:isoquinoline 1-oxidoreductase subunit beta